MDSFKSEFAQGRARRWLLIFAFWTAIALFYSLRALLPGSEGSWLDSLKLAVAQWYSWAILTPLIVRLDQRLPVGREALAARLLLHIPLSLIFTLAYFYLSNSLGALFLGELPGVFSAGLNMLLGGIYWNISFYWVIVGVYTAFEYQRVLKDRRLRAAELERLLAESRLETLRAQLHPHFLFNSLNAISAYVERDPAAARRMLEHLGDLLRLSLEHAEDSEIPLESEIAFVERYLDLQRMRFEDRLEVSVKTAPDALDAMVPTFLLQPLVENAVRHGISARPGPGIIEVNVWREGDRLRLQVSDDGPGLPAHWDPERDVGVGLRNTRERLRRLYAGDHTLSIAGPAGHGVCIDIDLPWRSTGAWISDAASSNEYATSTSRR